MKRALAVAALAIALGVVAVGQWCCPPPPPPAEPPCYTTFWVGEEIHFKVEYFWSFFCCCPCPDRAPLAGWRVEAFGGGVVYQVTFPTPMDPATVLIWKQVDMADAPVAPGYYKLVVLLATGKTVETHIKITPQPTCCFFLCGPVSIPCLTPMCGPYLKVWRGQRCACPTPCGFLFFLGCGCGR